MTLQEEMFSLVAEWRSSGLTKKLFLEEKSIGLAKFNYWCSLYNAHQQIGESPDHSDADHFHELIVTDAHSGRSVKVFELATPSGLRITVFE